MQTLHDPIQCSQFSLDCFVAGDMTFSELEDLADLFKNSYSKVNMGYSKDFLFSLFTEVWVGEFPELDWSLQEKLGEELADQVRCEHELAILPPHIQDRVLSMIKERT